jgi:hypothetical protein
MMMLDINYYYLGTPMPIYEYMRMPLERFPPDVIDKYNLDAILVDGWVYIEIKKGMYGLKHSGLLANQQLQIHVSPHGYFPARHIPGLWLHKTRPVIFSLIVMTLR